MRRLMIECPKTGEPVSTGVSMESDEFDLVEIEGKEFGCPACGETHFWDKPDAFLEK
jgi:hypothetical protein